MTNEEIIKNWRSGLTVMQVAKVYMTEFNKNAIRKLEQKITKTQALAYIEPIIFEFETRGWKNERRTKENNIRNEQFQ